MEIFPDEYIHFGADEIGFRRFSNCNFRSKLTFVRTLCMPQPMNETAELTSQNENDGAIFSRSTHFANCQKLDADDFMDARRPCA